MDFWSTVRVLLRRWYVAVPVFGVTLLAAAAVYAMVPKVYESTGTLVLVAPPGGATISPKDKTGGRTNPLLSFDESLNTTAQILIQTLGSKDVQKELGITANSPDSYTVGNSLLTGPFVVVVADSNQEARSKEIAGAVLDRARQELERRQTDLGAPPETFITGAQIVAPTPPEVKLGGKIRAAGVAFALGFAASLGSAYMLESMLLARRRREKEKLARQSTVTSPPPTRERPAQGDRWDSGRPGGAPGVRESLIPGPSPGPGERPWPGNRMG